MPGSLLRMPIDFGVRLSQSSSTAISGAIGTGLIGGWFLGLSGALAGIMVGLVVGASIHYYAAMQGADRPGRGSV